MDGKNRRKVFMEEEILPKLPKLHESKEVARQKIQERIYKGQQFRDRQIDTKDELENAVEKCERWSAYNECLLSNLFDKMPKRGYYSGFSGRGITYFGTGLGLPVREPAFSQKLDKYRKSMKSSIVSLEGILDLLELCSEPLDIALRTSGNTEPYVFIGHGRSQNWRELKDFISDELKLPWDEFNRVPVAGVTNIARLDEMLGQACMAFLVMTAEDEQADGKLRARENVVHEAGLFQGRLGFERAIVLLEEGCQEFSNIQGLGQIRFPKGNIKAAFEEIRQVLDREGIIR